MSGKNQGKVREILKWMISGNPAIISHCTVSGHKYFIKFQIRIDLHVFPNLLFNFLWVNKSSFRNET